jgi:hypothetical protein
MSDICAPRHMFPRRKENTLGGEYDVTIGAQITLKNICSCKSRTKKSSDYNKNSEEVHVRTD